MRWMQTRHFSVKVRYKGSPFLFWAWPQSDMLRLQNEIAEAAGKIPKECQEKSALAADPWATRRTAPCIQVQQGKHRTRRVTYSQETRASGFMLEANYKAQVYGVLRWQWNGCTVAVPSFLNPGSRRNAALDNQYSRTEFHNCMQIS